MPPFLKILPGPCGQYVAAVAVVEAAAIDTDAVTVVNVVVGTECLLAGQCVVVVASHGYALVLAVGHEGCHPTVKTRAVFNLAQFAAWRKDVSVWLITLAGIVGEMIVAHVAADIHLSVCKRHIGQEMPHIAHDVLYPAVAHGVAFRRVEVAFLHVGTPCGSPIGYAACGGPIGGLSAVANEAVGGDVDGWAVEGVDAAVTLFLHTRTAGKSEYVLLVSLADADVCSHSDKPSPGLFATGNGVCVLLVFL